MGAYAFMEWQSRFDWQHDDIPLGLRSDSESLWLYGIEARCNTWVD